jgi:hypothetical protein
VIIYFNIVTAIEYLLRNGLSIDDLNPKNIYINFGFRIDGLNEL